MMMQINSTSTNKADDLLGKVSQACVVGLGETGQSCLRYLADKDIQIVAMDSNSQSKKLAELKSQYPTAEFITGTFDSEALLASDLIVLSPGVPKNTDEIATASQAAVPVVGDIELFAHEIDDSKVISITGSNGKSTVTALCGELLKSAGIDAQIGGNIGYPALDLLDEPADVYVLELSSFQLESTYSLNSSVAVILNISPDHMDRYDSIDDYIKAKQRVFNQATNLVYNRADQNTYPVANNASKIISFGLDEPKSREDFGILNIAGQDWLCQGNNKLVVASSLRIKGQHNQLNALAAMALAYLIGADLEKTKSALIEFKGLEHRFEYVGNWNGVDWINDSKGTNPGATLASIIGQPKSIVLIVGGDGKGADFSILSEAINDHVNAVVLFGRDAWLVEKILPANIPRSSAADLEEAIASANKFATQNSMVLFSPACASFDMFKNYIERGNAFKTAVIEYFKKESNE